VFLRVFGVESLAGLGLEVPKWDSVGGGGRATRTGCGLGGAGGDFLEGAEGFVDRFRVGEGVEEVGSDEDDVGSLLLHRFRSRWRWLFVPR